MVDPAYRTISEVSALIGVPHHVLRFWETKFPVIAPLKRGGNRRYYRPEDVATIMTVARLLHHEGYTIKGAQKLLAAGDTDPGLANPSAVSAIAPPAVTSPVDDAPRRASPTIGSDSLPVGSLAAIRHDLAAALAAARSL